MRTRPCTIVFDLDGTLLNGDSTSVWMAARIGNSAWRALLAIAVLPFALPLFFYRPSRRIGASAILWVATVGMTQAELRRSFQRFAVDVAEGEKLVWRQAGIAELAGRLEAGDTALIATAAPAWLAESLVETLPFRVPVVGTSLARLFGGWVGHDHCRHQAKCDAITRAGYGDRWAAAYSDSADDAPLLARATAAFLVNASPRNARRLAVLRVEAERIEW